MYKEWTEHIKDKELMAIARQAHYEQKDIEQLKEICHIVEKAVKVSAYVKMDNHTADRLQVVMTLGEAPDTLQENYLQNGEILKAYMVDTISAELLHKAYISLIDKLMDTLENGSKQRWMKKYLFPGSQLPLSMNADILNQVNNNMLEYNVLVTCTQDYVLHPSKSVIYIAELTTHKEEACYSFCDNCTRENCPNRSYIQKTAPSLSEKTLQYSYGARRIFDSSLK